jgi:inositol transport system permease protein
MMAAGSPDARQPRRPVPESGILMVLVGIALLFEVLGWVIQHQSFLLNVDRLLIIVLQVSIVGLLALGVTQVIITAGIDLSLGSVLALAAMVAASLAQGADSYHPVYPALADLPWIVPLLAGVAVGLAAGLINGALVALTGIPPFIATLGMMVTARGLARAYAGGQPISLLTDRFTWIGGGAKPVVIFLAAAVVLHLALRHTRYGKFTYAIGSNPRAARVSGIRVGRHLVVVYGVSGLLAGLAGVVTAARAASGQAGMGLGYELDAIAATVIGGASLTGGVGRIGGTVIGTVILGVITSGFTFLGVDAYYQDIVKGVIIVAAVAVDMRRQRRSGKA